MKRADNNILKMFSLEGRVAIITGGKGLLGQEYTKTLSAAGATVIPFDISGTKDNVDITNEENVKSAVKKILKAHGKIDILINNAAMTDFSGFIKNNNRFGPYENFPLEIWGKEIGVGLTGALICSKAVIPHMKKRRSGVIVNVSSTHGIVAPDNRIYGKGKFKAITYPTIKAGILGFTRAMASYLAPHGIRVNTLSPGGVKTGYMETQFLRAYCHQTMLGRMAKKDEYNGAMLFLCSDASSYMTGANLVVDGGVTAW